MHAGLAKRLRFQSAPAHMQLLLFLIYRSPALASAVLGFRDLAPHNTSPEGARLRSAVAAACLESASRAAAPLHAALAQASRAGATQLPGGAAIRVSKSQVAGFLSSVMPPNIAKVRGLKSSPLAALKL